MSGIETIRQALDCGHPLRGRVLTVADQERALALLSEIESLLVVADMGVKFVLASGDLATARATAKKIDLDAVRALLGVVDD